MKLSKQLREEKRKSIAQTKWRTKKIPQRDDQMRCIVLEKSSGSGKDLQIRQHVIHSKSVFAASEVAIVAVSLACLPVVCEKRYLSRGYKQNMMQVMSLLVTATLRLIYCLTNIVKGKTYVHKRLIYIPIKAVFYVIKLFCFFFWEMEDISSVWRVSFGDRKKNLQSVIAESEGLFSQRK